MGITRLALALLYACAFLTEASAQIAQDQTLVIYDSRIADSRAVAEIYAGSRKVPGGSGIEPGIRPLVHVVNLANLGVTQTGPGNISYTNFNASLRSPIRIYLQSNNLSRRIRCLVTTKGLPHRVQDTDNPNNADFPTNGTGAFLPELGENDVTSTSVDTELMLLWQDLDNTEQGGSADSRADGVIQNPYWRANRSLATFDNLHLVANKTFTPGGTGPFWALAGVVGSESRLNIGDIYLVTRLDGRTVPAVRAMINRAANLYINTNTAALLFDEDGSDLDNSAGTFPTGNGDDYEQTVTAIQNDRRFSTTLPSPPPNVFYDNASGAVNFFVGPLLPWSGGIIRAEPVLFLATYGSNHGGVPTSNGQGGGTIYATSFNYAPGAIFNTIESYNGRDFGGLGQAPTASQQQAADFLNSGGTFAVCNVWEPLADTIPDNVFLMQNFVLGNLSWAEASWTSIPGLSWMQMSVGEPLARANRSNEDMDTNLRVAVDDVYVWQALPGTSAIKDVNRNGTADTTDRQIILNSIRAAERVNLTAGR